MTLRLYDLAGAQPERRFSPYCWRIRLALAHKNLPVETIPWRFTEKAEIAASGQTLVPVLVDGAGSRAPGPLQITLRTRSRIRRHCLAEREVGT